jgi:hypothetical protein
MAGFAGQRTTTVPRRGTRLLRLGCLGQVPARLHDLSAAAQPWITPTGIGLSLGVALAGRHGLGVTAPAVTRLAEPYHWAWLRRGVRVLPLGLARRLDSAINLASAQADVLGCSSQSWQQGRLAVVQGPAAGPVQSGIPVPLGLPGYEPHQMLKVLRPTVAVPGRCPSSPFRLRIEPSPDRGPVDLVSGRLVMHHHVRA